MESYNYSKFSLLPMNMHDRYTKHTARVWSVVCFETFEKAGVQ